MKTNHILFVVCIFFFTTGHIFAQNFWEATNGPYGGGVRALASKGDTIFAGTVSGGVFMTSDNGNTWIQKNVGLTNIDVLSLAISPIGYIFAGTFNGVFRSSDYGDHWTEADSSLDPTQNRTITNILVTSRGIVVIDNFRSSNNGVSWLPIKNINAVSLFLSNSRGDIFTITNTRDKDYLAHSSDDGQSWDSTLLVTSLGSYTNVKMAIDSSGFIYAGTLSQGIFRLSDTGNTWVQVNNGLQDEDISCLFINNHQNIFAGTAYGGVFRSTNYGNTWFAINSGLNDLYPSALTSNTDGYLFTGEALSIVYRSVQSTTGINIFNGAAIRSFLIAENYPNPFAISTTINFSLPQSGLVSLKIFDPLGKEVATLLNQELSAGNYSIPWRVGNLPAGVYQYRFLTGSQETTKELAIIK